MGEMIMTGKEGISRKKKPYDSATFERDLQYNPLGPRHVIRGKMAPSNRTNRSVIVNNSPFSFCTILGTCTKASLR